MFADRTRWNLEENRLSRELARAKAAGMPIRNLANSNPTDCGFTYNEELIRLSLSKAEVLCYEPNPRGLAVAREAVCNYYLQHCAALSADDLVLASGTSEAYSFLFRLLCNPGDEVLIPSPSYPLFDFLADLCDVKLVRYPLFYDHGWQLDFTALADAVSPRTRVLIVVHPNNPTGHYAAASEQSELRDFCAGRELALIVDEVFLDFSLAAAQPSTFAGASKTLTFTLSGLSKICGLPQMKLAWIAASGPEQPKQDALARLEVIADAYLSVGTPVQQATPQLLAARRSFHGQVMKRMRANLEQLDAQLARHPACNRLRCEGGWTAILRVPATLSDLDLAVELLQKQAVLVHPGDFYDFARPGHMVLSLIVPEQEFSEGVRCILAHFS